MVLISYYFEGFLLLKIKTTFSKEEYESYVETTLGISSRTSRRLISFYRLISRFPILIQSHLSYTQLCSNFDLIILTASKNQSFHLLLTNSSKKISFVIGKESVSVDEIEPNENVVLTTGEIEHSVVDDEPYQEYEDESAYECADDVNNDMIKLHLADKE